MFVALRAMAKRDFPAFDAWLRSRKPLCETSLFKEVGLCSAPFLTPLATSTSKTPPSPSKSVSAPAETVEPKTENSYQSVTARKITIGQRVEHGVLGAPVTLAADLLWRHIAIFAGSGSGKTVLLRRIVEEAVLLDIPAIVVDINNDLVRLGDAWPARPKGFSDDDQTKADAYQNRADVVSWA